MVSSVQKPNSYRAAACQDGTRKSAFNLIIGIKCHCHTRPGLYVVKTTHETTSTTCYFKWIYMKFSIHLHGTILLFDSDCPHIKIVTLSAGPSLYYAALVTIVIAS